MDLGRNFLLRLCNETALVAAQQIGLDRDVALTAFAADSRSTLAHRDLCQVALVIGVDGRTCESGLHCIVDVGNIDAQPCVAHAIDCHVEFALATQGNGGDIGGTWQGRQNRRDLFAFLAQDIEVGTGDLDGNFSFHARERLLDIVCDHLREIGRHPWYGPNPRRDRSGQAFLVGVAPIAVRLQIGEDFHVVLTFGVGAVVETADMRDHVADFREGPQNGAYLMLDFARVFKGRRWWQTDRQPNFTHLSDPFDDVVIVIEGDHAGQRPVADRDFGNVRDQHRAAVFGQHDHLRDIVDTVEDAEATHHHYLIAHLDNAAADVGTVVGERRGDLIDGHADARKTGTYYQPQGTDWFSGGVHRRCKNGAQAYPKPMADLGGVSFWKPR